ncbi:MAG: energy transducer TonB, partial [Pseudomonadota bacterium]|nr:energy transducer TonB [Pseudomonadota bacterium]
KKVEPAPKARPESKPRSEPAKAGPKSGEPGADHTRKGGGQPAGGSGAGSSKAAAEAGYLAELQRAIARHRFYPRKARRDGLEGVVRVFFVIEADGRITGVRIAGSSGSKLLDEAAVKTLNRLGRFKPIPGEIGRKRWPLRVPINFALH